MTDDCYDVAGEEGEKDEKVFVVAVTHAVVEEDAVVVEAVHAPVAEVAVGCSFWP
jgi:hypothetical protein